MSAAELSRFFHDLSIKRWHRTVVLGCCLCFASLASAQEPIVRIVDLNAQNTPLSPSQLETASYWAGRIYFEGLLDDGRELYSSDGTTAGTFQLADLLPGPASSSPSRFTRVGAIEGSNARVFFVAEDLINGEELWVTDGDPASTGLAVDFALGPDSSDPRSLTAWDGALYLTAEVSAERNLYRVDRSTLLATPLGLGAFELEPDAELAGTSTALHFAATSTATNALEIWSSDGSDSTEETSTGCESIGDLHVAGDFVFFVCQRASSVDILRVDASQPDGITTIHSHAGSVSIDELENAGGLLYWSIDGQQLWAFQASTEQVGVAATYAAGAGIGQLTRLGSRLLFRANSGDGFEPHVAEGFSASQLRDVFAGPSDGMDVVASFAIYDGLAYFRADDGLLGDELWRTDGTAVNTELAVDIEPGSAASGPFDFLATPLGLFFRRSNGGGLWLSDGAAAVRVDDLQRSSTFPQEVFYDNIGDRLFFGAVFQNLGSEPWVSDGSESGGFLLRDIHVGESSSGNHEFLAAFPRAGGGQPSLVVFEANDGVQNRQLWQSDGTPAGTELFSIINPLGSASTSPGAFLGEYYYFTATDGTTGRELWRSDGTPGGTERLTDLDASGDSFSSSAEFAVFADRLFFVADDGTTGRELWSTDGATLPSQLGDLSPGADSSSPNQLRVTPSRLWFVADDGNETFLWRSDGTEAGTEAVLQTSASNLTAVGDAVYFRHDDDVSGEELWRADASSVARVVDLTPGPDSSIIRIFGRIADRLVFSNDSGSGPGIDLWSTDGTADGLTLIGALESASWSSAAALTEHLYFPASIDGEGTELWRTNGLNLEMIDLEPGPTPSNPTTLVAAGDRLFFFAYDTTLKNELHVLITETQLFSDRFESTLRDTGSQ